VIDAQFVNVWLLRVVHNKNAMPPWLRDTVKRESLKLPKAMWQAGLEAMAIDDHQSALPTISARVRILHGLEDRFNPKMDAEHLEQRLPKEPGVSNRIVEIPAAGCVPHWDAPEAVAREINNALVPSTKAR
jgi:pimeloyl-ACP methyl ester carboxylesterase